MLACRQAARPAHVQAWGLAARGLLLAVGWSFLPWGAEPTRGAAPLYGRFQAYRTDAGYELRGFFGAPAGSPPEFALAPGMPANQARRQMRSVPWRQSRGLTDPQARTLWGRRELHGFVETISLVLDPAGRSVQSVTYTREPSLYSRDNLLRAFHAQFREGRMLVDLPDRVVIAYRSPAGQTLRAEANLLSGTQTHWRIVLRMAVPATVAAEPGH